MRTNQDYKEAALAALNGNWTPVVLATLVYIAVAALCTGTAELPVSVSKVFASASFLVAVLIINPLEVGYANAIRLFYNQRQNNVVENTFKIPLSDYGRVVITMLLVAVKTFLWALLLIIPGIVKSFAYSMTPYILVENPGMSASEAIRRSEEMMREHKFDLFYLYLSFIGWFILSVLTCGIGFFWSIPYSQTAVVAFYNDLKAENGFDVPDATIVG